MYIEDMVAKLVDAVEEGIVNDYTELIEMIEEMAEDE